MSNKLQITNSKLFIQISYLELEYWKLEFKIYVHTKT